MKNLKNLGKALNKAEQKEINGGKMRFCNAQLPCPTGYTCVKGCFCAPVLLEPAQA